MSEDKTKSEFDYLQEAISIAFRDKCAIAAMQGVLANSSIDPKTEDSLIAKMAFDMADKMELERQKRAAK